MVEFWIQKDILNTFRKSRRLVRMPTDGFYVNEGFGEWMFVLKLS